jgi:hypothetical protein
LGAFAPGDEHGAHHQVGRRDLLAHVLVVAVDELHVGRHHVAQVAQPVEVDVEQHHLGAEPGRHLRRVDPDDAAAEDHHLGRRHAGHAA